MDTLMLAVAVVSLAAAAVSTTVAFRVTTADRRLRAARVAALASAARVPLNPPSSHTVREADAVEDAATPTTATGLLRAAVADSGTGARQRALRGAAAVVGCVVLAVTGVWLVGGRGGPSASPAGRTPLELVALGHTRADGTFAVSGLVRNPHTGATIHELEADVRVFDAAGIIIATKAVRVDLADLRPGQESPFVLPMGEASTAARYRVSFRSGGSMVPHNDKRVSAPAAVSRTADAR